MNTSSNPRRPTCRPSPGADGRSQRPASSLVVVRSAGGKATDELTWPARQVPTRPVVCKREVRPEIDELSVAT
jgi:hypothetical protein